MTAASLLLLLNEVLYLLVAVGVVREAVGRPRRTAIDTALFMGALAIILELTGLSGQLGYVIPPVLTLILAAILLALPYLQLRLLDDYVGLRNRVLRAALAGLVLAIGSMVVVRAPIPAILTLALI